MGLSRYSQRSTYLDSTFLELITPVSRIVPSVGPPVGPASDHNINELFDQEVLPSVALRHQKKIYLET